MTRPYLVIPGELYDLVIKNLETYEENYHYAFKAVIEEWKEAKKDIDVPAIDKEAQNRASVETIKNEISILVNKESEDDVEREIKAKTDNERTMTAALKTSENIIAKLVSKSVDEALERWGRQESTNFSGSMY